MILLDSKSKVVHKPLVAAIGFFDGVHIGHRYLIEQVKAEAASAELSSAILTFTVHPRKVIQADYQPSLLCSHEEKLQRLEATGIEYCVPLDFTFDLSKLSAFDFMHRVLKEQYNVAALLVGYDHRFGHNRTDSIEDYVRYGKQMGIEVIQANELPGEHVSSSYIRSLLAKGDVRNAARLLLHNYTVSGKVVEGYKVGRTIGFPTANIELLEPFKVIPALGVYAVIVTVGDTKFKGMGYIGMRPTLRRNNGVSLEVNLFDFDGDLYGQNIGIEFVEFVRPDEKFENIDLLREQIARDKHAVLTILSV